LVLSTQTQHSVAGTWLGVLEAQGFKLRIVIKITQTPEGKLVAKMDSLDQAANDLPIDTITSEGGVVRFEARALSLSYEGKLNDDGSEIVGNLKARPCYFSGNVQADRKGTNPGPPTGSAKALSLQRRRSQLREHDRQGQTYRHPYPPSFQKASSCRRFDYRVRRAGS